jgi:hypothetical protein
MNLLSLEQFRVQIGYHPWHFWGLANSSQIPVTSNCNDLVQEYAWQNTDAVGRQEIRSAIATAEQRLFEYLGYMPMPRDREQTLDYAHLGRTGWYRGYAVGSDGRWAALDLNDGYVQAVGVETLTLIGSAAVVYTDEDNDGLDDTFTLTIATTVTEPDEIAAYFIVADRFGDTTLSEQWRVQPVTVTIASGTATIIGPSYLLVKPVLYQGISTKNGLDPAAAANFASNLVVYRKFIDPTGTTNATAQALMIWESTPCAGWHCCNTATYTNDARFDPAAVAYGIARAGIRNSRLGLIGLGPAAYNATSGIWSVTSFATGYEPDRVTVRYSAGLSLVNGQMDYAMQTVVARLAAAELDRGLCACDGANKTLYRWQTDLARTGGNNDEQFGAISQDDLSNPLGTRRGQIYAWRYIRNVRLGQGILI